MKPNPYKDCIHVVKGSVLVDIGPMQLTILAKKQGKSFTKAAVEGANTAIRLLGQVGRFRRHLKQSAFDLVDTTAFPEVVQRMIQSCVSTGETDLSPMSAVAGSISDIVAEQIEARGATKVIVENGGDIAIKLHDDEIAKIGVIPRLGGSGYTHVVDVNAESRVGGIATSGLGGLGFTKGVASAAISISPSAALSDVCSTLLGNSTVIESPKIRYKFAEELNPDTDIKGHRVTFRVDPLTPREASRCIQNGLQRARALMKKRVCNGAIIFVQGKIGMIPKNVARPVTMRM